MQAITKYFLDLLTMDGDYNQTNIYDLSLRKKVNSVVFQNDPKKPFSSDAILIEGTKKNITYAILSNSVLRIFENHKQKWAVQAK